MKVDLTDQFLKALVCDDGDRIEVKDAKRPGLTLRVYSSGKRMWMYEKRVKGGAKRKHTFGEYPQPIGLAKARAMALEIAAEAARGYDRVGEAAAERRVREAAEAKKVTVGAVIERYDALHLAPNLRTAAERKRQLVQTLSPFLSVAISDVTRTDLQSCIDAKAKEGRPVRANRIKAALSAFAKWAWRRGYTDEDIGAGLSKAVNEKARDLVLTVPQLRQIFAATHDLGNIWGPLFRLLILTAQRRGDIGALRWAEVEENRLSISGARTKNGKPHIVHLSAPALAELAALPRDHDLVFTTTGTTPVSGYGKAKARLDALLGEDFPSWRLHDLRTAFATEMAETGEGEAVVDRILNHVASVSAASTVARVYNRAEQLPQRARALDRWSDIISEDSANVIQMVR